MQDIFISFLNISIEAAVIICAFALIRLMLKKCPAYIRCIVWAVVALRLIIPISIESAFSLMPANISITETNSESVYPPETEHIESNKAPTTSLPNYTPPTEEQDSFESVAPVTPITPSTKPSAPVVPSVPEFESTPIVESVTESTDDNRKASPLQMLATAWITGLILMLCYIGFNLISTHLKTRNAAVYMDRIHLSTIKTPFVFGVIKPRIYLPAELTNKERRLIIAHESAHIQRGDHISKLFAFLVLALHWFNPFVWLGYILFCRDVELACDEKVIKNMTTEERQAYSFTLLKCATGKLGNSLSLLAFGEVGTKERIKNIMNYKKPTIWAICIVLVASIVIVTCFSTRPKDNDNNSISTDISNEYKEEVSEDISDTYEGFEHSTEIVPGKANYALGCEYDVYKDDILFQNGPGYLNGYDDTGFVKLTDGVVDESIYETGYGNADMNAIYEDLLKLTFCIDLGESYDDVGVLTLKNAYFSKTSGSDVSYFSPAVYISEDNVNYEFCTNDYTYNLIHETDEFVRKDYTFTFNGPVTGRYLRLDIRYYAKLFGLSEIEVNASEIVKGGAVEWSVSGDNTLTIKGKGSMYIDVYPAPWEDLKPHINKLVIEEGLTTIDTHGFSGFTALKSVVIPDTVKEIKPHAFSGCTALESIVLPNSIKTIGESAFSECKALTEVKLPNNLTSIDARAFQYCFKLKNITLPDSITTIGSYAFDWCEKISINKLPIALKTIGSNAFPDGAFGEKVVIPKSVINIAPNALGAQKYYEVESGSTAYSSENGVLFSSGKATLYAYPVLNEATEYVIPAGVKKIYGQAFAKATHLRKITLPDGLTTICESAFRDCVSLQSISLPDTVTAISSSTFANCTALKSVELPSSLTSIPLEMFIDCTALEKVSFPNGLTEITDSAFSGCVNLIITSLPDSLKTVNSYAFKGCRKLNCPLPSALTFIGCKAFSDCGFERLVIPENVYTISDFAFNGCSTLKSVHLPSKLANIYLAAFNNCTSLESVSYGNTVEKWLSVNIEPEVDSVSNITNFYGATVRCTDGTGGFMEVFSFDENGQFDKTACITYDGTVQGLVDGLRRSNATLYRINKDIKVNSFRIGKTEDADVQIAYIDLDEGFAVGFEEYPARKSTLIHTLANTLLNNHPQLKECDKVRISVNGTVISDDIGASPLPNETELSGYGPCLAT